MQIITIKQKTNASTCCQVAKSHQDDQGSQSEQLRTVVTFIRRCVCLQQSAPACRLTDRCVTVRSDSHGFELWNSTLIWSAVWLRHHGRESNFHSACSRLCYSAWFQTGLPGWPFWDQISEIWSQITLIGPKIFVWFFGSFLALF